jgi:glycosyltransferase involved in cell wall biosynthesis
MKSRIVYIGNNLKSANPTTQVLLAKLLTDLNYEVKLYSTKESKLVRLLDMCLGIIKNRNNTDFVLIDTYSSLNFYFALITSQLARFFNLKYIPILHGGNLCSRLKNNPFFSSLIFSNSFMNVSPSNYLLEEFQNKGFKTFFIPNPIVISEYAFYERETYDFNLLWVRAFDKIYNPKMAISVLNELNRRGLSVKLCMVGPDKDGSLNEVIQMAKEKNVYHFLEITGLLSKSEWIKKSTQFDIFINTTTVDNVPVSVIEAMALGLPVISTNVGGIPYLIKNSVNGILVENDDEIEMADAIAELIQNQNKAKILVRNARKKVENFDINVVKDNWQKLLTV